MMVLHEALKDNPDNVYYALLSLCHDLGKPDAQVNINNKVYFTGHEGISVFKSINFLQDILQHSGYFGLKQEFNILNLLYVINYHRVLDLREPKWLKQYFDGNKSLLDDIYYFSTLDDRGRIHEGGGSDNKHKIDSFSDSHISNYDISDSTIVVLIGVSGSGKTTLREKYEKGGFYVISRDDLILSCSGTDNYNDAWGKVDQNEIDKQLMKQFHTLCRENKNIVIDMTNTSIKSRKKWYKPKGYKYHYHILLPDYEVLAERNALREDKVISWDNVVVKQMKKFQLPLWGEQNKKVASMKVQYNGC